ncbi:MAG: hypothetical protein ABIQ89_01635 [Candidatus Saccharimonadales bacterium]
MNEKTPLSKALSALIVVLGLTLVGLAAFFAYRYFSTRPNAYVSGPFAQNIQFPYRADGDQLYFYTGHGFASMDVTTKKTKQLGEARLLPNTPSSVQWTKGGAYILASSYTIFDDLGSMVPSTSLGQSSKAAYLWYVPFTGKPVVVDKNVSTYYVDFATSVAYYHWKINPNADGALLKDYSPATGVSQNLLASGLGDAFKVVFASGGDVWALTGFGRTTSLMKYNPLKEPETISKDVFGTSSATVDGPFVMPNASFYVATITNDKKSQLISYDTATNKTVVVDKDFSGTINRGSDKLVFANSTKKQIATIRRFSSAADYSSLSAKLKDGSIVSSFEAGNNWLNIDLLNQARVMAKTQSETKGLPTIKNTGLEKALQATGAYDISIDLSNAATSNTYAVNVYPPYPNNVAALLQQISAAGYDSNQLQLQLNYTVKRQ